MKKFVLIFVLFIAANYAYSQTPAKKENIKILLDLSGSGKMGIQVMENMFASYKKAFPSVPADVWSEVMKEVNADSLISLIVPIYQKHFTDEDVLQMIEFYKSPVGMKLTRLLPSITQEAMEVGGEWGKRISERVNLKLSEKGYLQPRP